LMPESILFFAIISSIAYASFRSSYDILA